MCIIQASDINSIQPYEYGLLITSWDGVDNSQVLLTTNFTVETGSLFVLIASEHMPSNRIWDAIVLAYNCSENILSDQLELSKFETGVSFQWNAWILYARPARIITLSKGHTQLSGNFSNHIKSMKIPYIHLVG